MLVLLKARCSSLYIYCFQSAPRSGAFSIHPKRSWLVTCDRDLSEDVCSSTRLKPWNLQPSSWAERLLPRSLSLSFFSIPHSECSKGETLKQTPKPERSARGFALATVSANLPSVLTVKPLMPPSSARSSKNSYLLLLAWTLRLGAAFVNRRGDVVSRVCRLSSLLFCLPASICVLQGEALLAPSRFAWCSSFLPEPLIKPGERGKGGGNVSLPLEAPSLRHRRGQGRREWKASSLCGACCLTLWVQTERSDNLMSCSARQHSDGARWLKVLHHSDVHWEK